jgi:hypothetical protein
MMVVVALTLTWGSTVSAAGILGEKVTTDVSVVYYHHDFSIDGGPNIQADQWGPRLLLKIGVTENFDLGVWGEYLDNLSNGDYPASGNIGVNGEYRIAGTPVFLKGALTYEGASVVGPQNLISMAQVGIRF